MYIKFLAVMMVCSLCAIMMIVKSGSRVAIAFIASCTSFSLLGSSALVASSKMRILGFLIKALAMAILCFYPPDMLRTLADPMYVSSLFSISKTNVAFAFYKASYMSMSVASLFPKSRLSLMVPRMSTGSYETYPMDSLRVFNEMSLMLISSK